MAELNTRSLNPKPGITSWCCHGYSHQKLCTRDEVVRGRRSEYGACSPSLQLSSGSKSYQDCGDSCFCSPGHLFPPPPPRWYLSSWIISFCAIMTPTLLKSGFNFVHASECSGFAHILRYLNASAVSHVAFLNV